MIVSPYTAPVDIPATDLFLIMLKKRGALLRKAPQMMAIPMALTMRLVKHCDVRIGMLLRHTSGETSGEGLLPHAHSASVSLKAILKMMLVVLVAQAQ